MESKNTVIVSQPGGDDGFAEDAAEACAFCAVLFGCCACCIAPLVGCCACLSCCLPDDHPSKPPKPAPRR